jgi:hypothetical protein
MVIAASALFAVMASQAISAASIAPPPHGQSVQVVPYIGEVTRGNNPQWVEVGGGMWSPSPAQLRTVRDEFRAYVQAQARDARADLSPWESYTFQYQGQLLRGKRVLFIYAFCQMAADYPRRRLARQFYLVSDGGPCYFRAWWSPRSDTFIGVSFNGMG